MKKEENVIPHRKGVHAVKMYIQNSAPYGKITLKYRFSYDHQSNVEAGQYLDG